jgi:rhodanese-related sulfurtransferase
MTSVRPLRILILIVAALASGLIANALNPRGLSLNTNVFIKPGDELIQAAEAKQRHDQGALFIDARPEIVYKLGHIPGALWLPDDAFDRVFPQIESKLRGRFDIVVYCSGYGCESSHIVARRLKALQIPAVILQDGEPAWSEAGYPLRVGLNP